MISPWWLLLAFALGLLGGLLVFCMMSGGDDD